MTLTPGGIELDYNIESSTSGRALEATKPFSHFARYTMLSFLLGKLWLALAKHVLLHRSGWSSLIVLQFLGCLPNAPEVKEPSAPKASSATATTAEGPTIEKFIEYAQQGDVAQVQRAIRNGIKVDTQNAEGLSALMIAAFEGHTLVVETLLKNGATVDLKNELNRTALMFAATGKSVETVEVLLKAGANINAFDSHESWTPLMLAAAEGNLEVVRKLLEYKPDLTRRELDGESALDFAIQRKHTEVVELLQSQMPKVEKSSPEKK